MTNSIKHLLAALQFLTILPIRREASLEDIGRSQPWFPAAGLVVGAGAVFCYLLAWAAGFPVVVAALFGTFALSGFSGFFHMDGVADTADGFFSSRPREQVLEIMRDSRIGTMGVVGIFFVIGLKWASLVALPPELGWRVLIVAAITGRSAQVLSIAMLPYARKSGGLVSVFMEARSKKNVWIVLAAALVAAIFLCGGKGLFALAAAGFVGVLFSRWCVNKIGGITGDTLGAITELTEAVLICTMCIGIR